jgi:hypothetical protein
MQADRETPTCELRKASAPWQSNHLYVGDSGEVLCGNCMGIESTYTPWAWSDLGPMRLDRTIDWDGMVVRCEMDQYGRGKKT